MVRVEGGQKEAWPAVEEPGAGHVHPEEPAGRPQHEVREPDWPPASDPCLGGQRRVPVGARQEIGHPAVAPVDERCPEPSDGPGHLHRLVDGVVHELAPAALEQPELPVWIEAAVTEPGAPEAVPPRYAGAGRGIPEALAPP